MIQVMLVDIRTKIHMIVNNWINVKYIPNNLNIINITKQNHRL